MRRFRKEFGLKKARILRERLIPVSQRLKIGINRPPLPWQSPKNIEALWSPYFVLLTRLLCLSLLHLEFQLTSNNSSLEFAKRGSSHPRLQQSGAYSGKHFHFWFCIIKARNRADCCIGEARKAWLVLERIPPQCSLWQQIGTGVTLHVGSDQILSDSLWDAANLFYAIFL